MTWQLLLPMKRSTILATRALYVFSLFMQFFSLLTGSLFIGLMAKIVVNPSLMTEVKGALPFICGIFLFTIVMTIVNILIIHVTPYLTSSKVRTILLFPVYLLYLAGIWIPILVFDIDNLSFNGHFWLTLLLLIVIGLPLGIGCLIMGAKYLNDSLDMQLERLELPTTYLTFRSD